MVDILVLIAISRKSDGYLHVLMYITNVQTGKYFSRCTAQDSEMCDELD